MSRIQESIGQDEELLRSVEALKEKFLRGPSEDEEMSHPRGMSQVLSTPSLPSSSISPASAGALNTAPASNLLVIKLV
jgi:hypothetical protein